MISVSVRTPDGLLLREGVELGDLDWSTASPIRESLVFPKQRNMPGEVFSSTNGDFVGYESLLERDWILVKDFDPDVVRILEQPFEIRFWDGSKERLHVPDLLVEKSGGEFAVCDVRSGTRLDEQFERQAQATLIACSRSEWAYEVLIEPDPLFIANITWLAGYRQPCNSETEDVQRILASMKNGSSTIKATLASCLEPVLAMPILMQFMWRGIVGVDLYSKLDEESEIWLQ